MRQQSLRRVCIRLSRLCNAALLPMRFIAGLGRSMCHVTVHKHNQWRLGPAGVCDLDHRVSTTGGSQKWQLASTIRNLFERWTFFSSLKTEKNNNSAVSVLSVGWKNMGQWRFLVTQIIWRQNNSCNFVGTSPIFKRLLKFCRQVSKATYC